jgi:L-lactate dehydrogenase (cytochrome)
LSAGGQEGVERVVGKLRDEVERGMTLMGCRSVKEITKDKITFR